MNINEKFGNDVTLEHIKSSIGLFFFSFTYFKSPSKDMM